MPRFVWPSYVTIEADTAEEAVEFMERYKPDGWFQIADGVATWMPSGPPIDFIDPEDSDE